MKSIKYLIFILLHVKNLQGQVIKIFLQGNDCNTCTASLSLIKKYNSEIPLLFYFKTEDIRDSNFVYKKYDIQHTQFTKIWNDSEFKKYNINDISEVLVVADSNQGVIYKSGIKHFDFTLFKQKISHKICRIQPPKKSNFCTYNNRLIIHNKYDNSHYILNYKTKMIDTIVLTDGIVNQLYNSNEHKFEQYLSTKSTVSSFISKVVEAENDTLVALAIIYYQLKGTKIATNIILKDYFILKYLDKKIIKTISVNSFIPDSNFGFVEHQFHYFKDKLYFPIIFKNNSSQLSYFNRFIAIFEIQNQNYHFTKLSEMELPKSHTDNGINYRNLVFRGFQNYISMPFSNEIIDIENNVKITIPIQDTVLRKLSTFLSNTSKGFPFFLIDFGIVNDEIEALYTVYNQQFHIKYNYKQNQIIFDELFNQEEKFYRTNVLKSTLGVLYNTTFDDCIYFNYK